MSDVEDRLLGAPRTDLYESDVPADVPAGLGGVAPRLALFLITAVHAGFAGLGVLNILRWQREFLGVAGGVAILVGFFALQLFHCNPYIVRLRDRLGPWTLLLQGGLAFAPLPMAGVLWGSFGGFLSGAVLVVLRGTMFAWAMYGLVAAAVCGLALDRFGGLGAAYLALSSLVIGLMVYGLTRLSDLVFEQRRARDEAAWVAVSKERLRFARDLHDLLGYSLSAITLKNELTYRLIGSNDDRAREEVAETLRIARQALTDVRAVVSGYRTVSLAMELRSVGGVLSAAGVEATVDGDPGELEPRISTMLAIVLREAVTNLLRHSSATRCRIVLGHHRGRVRIAVSNDGVAAHPSAIAARRGSGLDNLAGRVASVGGELTTAVDGGWFHLRAECPPTSEERSASCTPDPHLVDDGR